LFFIFCDSAEKNKRKLFRKPADKSMNRIKSLPGTYALVINCRDTKKVEVGKLGIMNLLPGYYIYVGSAFGPGGLRARVHRHVAGSEKKHWHLDYIKMFTHPLELWYSYDPEIREHQWAEAIVEDRNARVLMKGFGSSDCSCASHLFFLNKRPSSDVFFDRIHKENKVHDPVCILKL